MNKNYSFSLVLLLFLFVSGITLSQSPPETWPTFDMTVKNIESSPTYPPGPNQQDSILTFDVYLMQTNYGQPGIQPFEFCCAQYNWYFNKNIFQNPSVGNAVLTNQVNFTDLPANLSPPTFQVDSVTNYEVNGQPAGTGLLKTSSNLPNSSINYFISSNFPGTKILQMKLRTNGRIWNCVPLNLKFKLGAAPNTFLAYFIPHTGGDTTRPQYAQSLLDTVTNQYIIEGEWYCLPVEMESFVSSVNGKNVELNWTTSAETNNQLFDIERSVSNSNEWKKIGTIQGSGTTTEPRSYIFKDNGVNTGHYTYRLKQIDFNGTVNYHELSAEVIVGVPTAYAISQNYPNPFNPTTKIDYELPYDGKVSILLYDISGREVAKLVNEVKTAGYYTAQFNGANLSSGTYFYRIAAEGADQKFVATKKMVLIK